MKNKPSRPAIIVLVVVGLIAYLALGYLLVISPQRSKSADLKKQVAETEAQIDQYRTLSAQARSAAPIRVADLFRLEKAMPNEIDMAGIVLELSRIAGATGIEFESITPQGVVAAPGYQVLPVNLIFDGNYFELSDFLYRLRSLVRVRAGRLASSGRLFIVDSMSFSESEKSFPRIQASLVVNAYVYGDAPVPGAAPPAAAAPATTTASTSTLGETTTTATTPETPPAGASAAPGGTP
jgi:Tfp pilus assembly protein PilO